MRMGIATLVAAGLGLAGASHAMAQANRAAPKNASEAIVINARSVAVTGLEITSAKGDKVGTLQTALEPGKSQVFKFRPRNGCVFTIAASFADEATLEPTELDLCTDKTIRFTD